eukprot:SM000006S19456  [mRNA]  locus=s6:886150:888414:- [translate_table: standard]
MWPALPSRPSRLLPPTLLLARIGSRAACGLLAPAVPCAQSRARSWIEEVLDEDLPPEELGDVLADGELLDRVGRLVKRLKAGGDGRSPLKSPAPAVGKSKSGKSWHAFSNVCRELGMPDVETCSAVDIVEQKDLRRVCLCLRGLSKKARAEGLMEVPDFDDLTHRARGMSTAKVQGLQAGFKQQQAPPPELEKRPASGSRIKESSNGQASEPKDEQGHEPIRKPKPHANLDTAHSEKVASQATSGGGDVRGGPPWAVIGTIAAAAITLFLSMRKQVYEVRRGDTLINISQKVGKKRWEELVKLNPNIDDPDLIYPHERLRLL